MVEETPSGHEPVFGIESQEVTDQLPNPGRNGERQNRLGRLLTQPSQPVPSLFVLEGQPAGWVDQPRQSLAERPRKTGSSEAASHERVQAFQAASLLRR